MQMSRNKFWKTQSYWWGYSKDFSFGVIFLCVKIFSLLSLSSVSWIFYLARLFNAKLYGLTSPNLTSRRKDPIIIFFWNHKLIPWFIEVVWRFLLRMRKRLPQQCACHTSSMTNKGCELRSNVSCCQNFIAESISEIKRQKI